MERSEVKSLKRKCEHRFGRTYSDLRQTRAKIARVRSTIITK